ncbi:protein phosphatase 2C domain-containing protein [Sphingomonas sp.]|jgi:serine/threonine-protein phosphatase Stp1|uniref:PP2C family protein-serine/threonine phosphatase n=1 Tax=Sphingomonas sp. TaxID=28214 RepID=UPI0025D8DAF9|nr:protein phosphatase 2C domain-containing protein [Sphingomonas sp.]
MGFECVTRTHVGLRRKVNEDSLLECTERGLWAVADGMGGHEAGEVASAMVVEALAGLPITSNLEADTANAVSAMIRVNQELIVLARSDIHPRTIGSTVVGLIIRDGQYRCFWAGDSRAYRVRSGVIRQLTRDHSLVQELVEAGMIAPDEAHNHPNANVITRAVGAAETLIVDTVGGDARPGDQFLLASDGLTRLVDDGEMRDEMAEFEPSEAAGKLLDAVLVRGAPDNVSLIIIKVV